MGSSASPVLVVLLVGPQASGKSTVARSLVEALRERDERAALIELDAIAGMALPTLPSWDVAADVFATVIGEWARSDLTCVVAEGIASRSEIDLVSARVPEPAAIMTIALTTPLGTAVPRALADPTRGISRDERWLSDRYDEWRRERALIDEDLALDMGSLSVQEGVARAVAAIEVKRSELLDESRRHGTAPGPAAARRASGRSVGRLSAAARSRCADVLSRLARLETRRPPAFSQAARAPSGRSARRGGRRRSRCRC